MSPSSDRRGYFLLLASAFLWGTSTSQLNLLAVVLRQGGISEPAIAFIFSSSTVAVVAATLISGALASRIGAVHTLFIGGLISLAAVIALPFAVGSAPLAALAKAGQGFGFGLFTPAGQLFAKSRAREEDQILAVGRFTAMFLVPTFFAPVLGEWSLRHWGTTAFFVLAMPPLGLGLLLVQRLPRDGETPSPPDTAGYVALLRNRRLWLPNAAAMQSGLAYAFAFSFLPLMLVESGTPVAAFFSPFAVVLLTTRFVGLKHLQGLAVPLLAALGLLAYAIGLGFLTVSAPILPAALAGCLMALGYAVIHPTCVQWSSRQYPVAERARPVALINTTFNLGSVFAMQTTGSLLPILGWRAVLMILMLTIVAVLAMLLAATVQDRYESRKAALADRAA
jgi:MFS family permease